RAIVLLTLESAFSKAGAFSREFGTCRLSSGGRRRSGCGRSLKGEESGRRRSRFQSEADQDSGGKPITYSGAKPISDSRLKAISNRPRAEWVIGFSGIFHRRLGRVALDITRQVSLPPGGELASQEIVHAQDQRSFTFEV